MNAKKTVTKPAPKSAKPVAATAAAADTGFGVADLAREFKRSAYDTRRALRSIGAKRPGGRWTWPNAKSVTADTRAKIAEFFGIEATKKTVAKSAAK